VFWAEYTYCFIENTSVSHYLTKYCQQEGGLVVGIANALRAGRPKNQGFISSKDNRVSSPALEPSWPLNQWGPLFPVGKAEGT
jgi:hypothetical protein